MKVFSIIIIAVVVFLFCGNAATFIRFYIVDAIKINFLYPSVEYSLERSIEFFIGIALGIVIPAVLCLSVFFILKKVQKNKKYLILVSIIPIIILFVFNNFLSIGYFEFFALAGFYSHTEDVSDFGVYDDVVAEIIEEYELNKFLPEEDLVKKYGKYDYRYEYFFFREHRFVIEIDIEFPDSDTYDKEVSRILSINSPTEVTVDNIYCDYYGCKTEPDSKPWVGAISRLKSAVFDDASKTIIYVIEYGVRDSFLEDYLQTKSDNNN